MNLYEINNAILGCVDDETGEVLDVEKLKTLEMEQVTKIENIALWIKSLDYEAEAIKKEEEVLAERRKAKVKKVEQLKEYLASTIAGQKYSTPRMQIGWRKSQSCKIIDENAIPDKFVKVEVVKTLSIDKTAIKKAINSGEVVAGAVVVEKQNVQIK